MTLDIGEITIAIVPTAIDLVAFFIQLVTVINALLLLIFVAFTALASLAFPQGSTEFLLSFLHSILRFATTMSFGSREGKESGTD